MNKKLEHDLNKEKGGVGKMICSLLGKQVFIISLVYLEGSIFYCLKEKYLLSSRFMSVFMR